MDARPRQLLIAFLSTEIGCKLRKLRPTQTRGLLDEFCNPPTVFLTRLSTVRGTVFQYQFLDYFAEFYMWKRKFDHSEHLAGSQNLGILIAFCRIWDLSLGRVAYSFQELQPAQKNWYINPRSAIWVVGSAGCIYICTSLYSCSLQMYGCTAVRVPVQLQLLVSTAVPSNIGRSVDTSKFLFPCSMRAFCTVTRTFPLYSQVRFSHKKTTPPPILHISLRKF